MEVEWINKIVDKLKKEYLTNNPYELCKSLDIKIKKVKPNYYLLAGKKSVYFKDFYGEKIIFIRDGLYGYDEEFVLRHELGHVLLHPNILCSNHINKGKLDKQADYFALILNGIKFDTVLTENLTLQQLASCEKVPYETLYQLANFIVPNRTNVHLKIIK